MIFGNIFRISTRRWLLRSSFAQGNMMEHDSRIHNRKRRNMTSCQSGSPDILIMFPVLLILFAQRVINHQAFHEALVGSMFVEQLFLTTFCWNVPMLRNYASVRFTLLEMPENQTYLAFVSNLCTTTCSDCYELFVFENVGVFRRLFAKTSRRRHKLIKCIID